MCTVVSRRMAVLVNNAIRGYEMTVPVPTNVDTRESCPARFATLRIPAHMRPSCLLALPSRCSSDVDAANARHEHLLVPKRPLRTETDDVSVLLRCRDRPPPPQSFLLSFLDGKNDKRPAWQRVG